MNQMGGLPGLPGTGAKLPPGFQNFMNVKKK
jgi:signal recognition particle subunit SRP54